MHASSEGVNADADDTDVHADGGGPKEAWLESSMDAAPVLSSMQRPSGSDSPEQRDALEESYSKAPPAARWVWDRIMSQDKHTEAGVLALEKRTLLAFDSLSCGGKLSS